MQLTKPARAAGGSGGLASPRRCGALPAREVAFELQRWAALQRKCRIRCGWILCRAEAIVCRPDIAGAP